jgi:hypothetical protein
MADDVHEDIENAVNTIASTTEQSGNMKKELKHTIYETVSTLRRLFVKLKDMSDDKSRTITELGKLVASTMAGMEEGSDIVTKRQATPSSTPRGKQAKPTERSVAPSGPEPAKHPTAGKDQTRLYSEVLGEKFKS